MRRLPLFWQLFPVWVCITLGALGLLVVYGQRALREFFVAETTSVLEGHARLFAVHVHDRIAQQDYAAVDTEAKKLGKAAGIRVTVVLLPSGKVVADSKENPVSMDDHSRRPEIAAAWRTGTPQYAIRFSDTTQQELIYLALPLAGQQTSGVVVRTAMPIALLTQTVGSLQRRLAWGGLVVAVLVVAFSWIAVRRLTRPLRTIQQGAARFSSGELEHRVRVSGSAEMVAVAGTLNQMAAQLHQRIEAMIQQRDEQDAMLASMVEGVLALDREGRILRVNPAFAGMFQLTAEAVRGRPIHEILRKAELLRFVETALGQALPYKEELVIHGLEDRVLAAQATALHNAQGQPIGVLIVLHDVTRLRHLERLRRDFVANVSHELRTPITSIKGFVETLLDGALEDRENAERFLRIILAEADRLNALVNDLLILARIEKDEAEATVELAPGLVADVVEAAVRARADQAEDKEIHVHASCPPDVGARINPRLLEQALTNLLDNAIKYSEPGSRVEIRVRQEPASVVIEVADQGCGIEAKHLPRLFERFYRVDPARSDALGGTGLGLAIVKHIVQAHGGSVSVESQVGIGSTFRIHLPRPKP